MEHVNMWARMYADWLNTQVDLLKAGEPVTITSATELEKDVRACLPQRQFRVTQHIAEDEVVGDIKSMRVELIN